ncbi:MAG: DNA polymerase III subunit alpha [Thermodesulfobacteriota bacterium]
MIPLTVRSGYSLMWGASGVQALCRHARRLGYDRLALTDTDNLYGLWPFLTACDQEGIRPIVGAEVTDPKTKTRAVCLVKNTEGYGRLCRLLTRRHARADFDLKSSIIELSEGLAVLTGSPGLLHAGYTAGIDIAAAMPRRPVSASHPLRRTARDLNIPVVAVPGSFFLHPEDAAVHRVLRAIDRNTSLCRLTPGDTAPADAFLASPEIYRERFAVCPEAIENTAAVAERITFTHPNFGLVMPPFEAGPPEEALVRLRRAAYAGARDRYGELSETVVERLEHELRIIAEMGFCGYFLIVADIVRRSPRTCGRGSGAASLVAYCLGITNVCPVKHNLYFERFLNPGRKDPPDIDVDFAWDERDDVIAGVLDQYAGRAAMVSNHICFQPRMAVRETARVFGLTDREIKQITDRLPWLWRAHEADGNLQERIAALPQLRGIDFSEPWPEILSIAQRIIGLPRYLSVHPGGVVITPGRIDDYVPIQTAPKGVPILQWEKDAVEDAGLVKIDLLGNRSLGVIRDTLADMHANHIDFDEQRWEPEDDFPTQENLARGNTMGCFYIESPAMRLLQQKTRVGDFEHLVIHSSIIRPAANEVIQEYIHRLHGGGWTPIHPLMDDVLGETFGLMVYQEDVSRVAVRVAGFSHAEADGLRKVMSKKDREHRLRDYHERFVTGARFRGVDDDCIDKIWRMIMSFNGYSFCKPHSASYARVSFQAAYLKTHHPAEFMAAVISNQGGFYSAFAYVSEARRLGLTVLPPDVRESRIRWTGREHTLRVGFLSIKDLSAPTRNRIIEERRKRPFAGPADFFERIRPDETEARALIHCGALDRFHPRQHRPVLLWQFSARQKTRHRKNRNLSLFDDPAPAAMPDLPEDDPRERLRREFRVLGFLCDRHPMTLFEDRLKHLHTVKAVDIPKHLGRRVRFAGWLITGKTILTSKGDPMKFVSFEDETGIVETTLFPKIYHRFCHILDYGRPFLLSGKVEENWGASTLTVDGVGAV